jgi:hypothetical protein
MESTRTGGKGYVLVCDTRFSAHVLKLVCSQNNEFVLLKDVVKYILRSAWHIDDWIWAVSNSQFAISKRHFSPTFQAQQNVVVLHELRTRIQISILSPRDIRTGSDA